MIDPAVLAFALALGFARGASLGPANAEALRLLAGGAVPARRAAMLVQAGALAGELGWAVLALLGLGMMLPGADLHRAFAVVGGVLLAAYGLGGLRAAATRSGEPAIDPAARRPGAGPFGTGASFAATRVVSPVLWLGVGAWLLARLPLGGELGGQAAFLGAVALGWAAWAALLVALVVAGGGRASPVGRVARTADVAAGLLLVGLGVAVLATTLA